MGKNQKSFLKHADVIRHWTRHMTHSAFPLGALSDCGPSDDSSVVLLEFLMIPPPSVLGL
jgi:hypothetical protein